MTTAVPTVGVMSVGDGHVAFADDRSDDDDPGLKSLLRETLETVVLAILIFLVIRSLVQNYRIEGQSMEPNFQHGQYLLVNKLAYRLGEYRRGDVIVFHYPNNPSQDYIKRVIGLPGDTVEFRDGVLIVNGLTVEEPYDQIPIARDIPAQTVAPGFLYVLGDNRPASSDTRTWGQLSQEFVIGKAWVAIWPVEKAGVVEHPAIEIGSVLELTP
ncbi:MAG: signal peptidase I [Caldilineaceae bacterium]|nr:signal peptidase I [Caldilineaceae bacterium]